MIEKLKYYKTHNGLKAVMYFKPNGFYALRY